MERPVRGAGAGQALMPSTGLRNFVIALTRRSALGVLTIWLVATITFALVANAPGDPMLALMGDDGDAEVRARAAQSFGADRPALVRYAAWMVHLASFDLGTSMSFRAPVAEVIFGRLPATLALMLPALLLSSGLAILFALTPAAARSWRRGAKLALGAALSAMPVFVLAQGLIYVFALKLAWLPMQGLSDPRAPSAGFAAALDAARHLALPIVALTLHQLIVSWLFLRARIGEESRRLYLRTALAKGLSLGQATRRHLWPNARLGFLHFVAARTGSLLAGAVLVENVFGIAGMGRLIVTASLARDIPLVTGIFLCVAALVVAANAVADAWSVFLDPRLEGGQPDAA